MSDSESSAKPASFTVWEALIPVVALIVFLREGLVRYQGTPHIPLLLAGIVAAGMGVRKGCSWKFIEQGIVEGIAIGLKAILILLVVGMLIGTWITSGIVPVLIYHGLNLLSPSIFLVAACLICCVVSVATGSSWTTAGTVGIALIGVGQGLGISPAMAAGAIISGSYFGDKLSPLSDTTNLAAAVTGAELFEHIRYMLHTTIPALVIALVLYALLGSTSGQGGDAAMVTLIRETLSKSFNLNPILLLPPLFVIVMVVFRLPALPALMAGVVLGALLAGFVQGVPVSKILGAAQAGFVSTTGVENVDKLLSRGGLEGMMPTVSLILCALAFGGVMERTGLLPTLAGAIMKLAQGTGKMVAATVVTCFGVNILAPDQYLSIVLPGRMYKEAYEQSGLQPKVLSRTLEDAGTLSSPLIPWNACGAFMGGTLGVTAASYAPYAFFNLLCPVIGIVIASMGWKIARIDSKSNSGAREP